MDWRDVVVVGVLGGIGFTMSIFIADLSFGLKGEEQLKIAKLSVFMASLFSALLACLLLIGRKKRAV